MKPAWLFLCAAVLAPLAFGQTSAMLPAGSETTPTDSGTVKMRAPVEDSADEEPIHTFRKNVNEVAVVFTVVNKRGRPMRDLHREAFQVLDDHKPVPELVSFVRETD